MELPAFAVDGTQSRWASGKAQAGNEWLEIDFGVVTTIDTITLEQADSPADYPRALTVRLSNEAQDFDASPVFTGPGAEMVTFTVRLSRPVTGRYLLLAQTGTAPQAWWTVSELSVGCSP